MSAPDARPAGNLDLASGVGLVAADMIGTGVLLSAGFMAQDMAAGPILLAWVFGAALALCGAWAYGGVAALSGRSGGEYRYLSDYVHPFLGYLAGWGSLLLGFTAPVAVDGLAIGAYLNTIGHGPDPRITATLVIVALTAMHAANLTFSKWSQNALILVKVVLLVGFVVTGVALGAHAWPTWTPPNGKGGFPFQSFIDNQFWIAFAFSGWNAAIYIAGEFREPKRDVPRAMVFGAGLVGLLYLAVNLVFVANLTPQDATVVFSDDDAKTTLAHAVFSHLVGPIGASLMSGAVMLTLFSAMSAMTMVGPRVYAAMADDGYLPAPLKTRAGAPPLGAILLQSTIAIGFVYTHTILQAVQTTSAALMIFSGLTVLSLFVVMWQRPDLPAPRISALFAAAIYTLVVAFILYKGVFAHPWAFLALVPVTVLAAIAWFLTPQSKPQTPPAQGLP